MRKLIISALLGVFVASPALADWIGDFSGNNETQGIEVAVAEALKTGRDPSSIVVEGLKLPGVNPQHILKALYCAGSDGDDIKTAADNSGISDIILIAAFNKSIAECGDAVADDTQAYTPATRGPSFAGMPAPPGTRGPRSFASPSTF
jgi:hypothetical protein